ncbi:uncharacterized protein CANTADRAFT_27732 [Suhomyces tanzawaensis NRRL Y-17324]|uniref:Transcription factor domain-containing protein n=1 Tax=Suhomyces tanzawaensis NRRL Y-17324 TaxID=984487 RepID=A0A1E4SB14_9ASCO|nr:uncharacterized protein CANTADRAFT_27732 [Suhomyces tanzawaensis NRRL Y-17324]ODV76717.1 hypothetical protein CANTADRAFT_27732 [Suhomyces tanzawaensis NRRL Y-17324]
MDNFTENSSVTDLSTVFSPLPEAAPAIKIADVVWYLQAYQSWFYSVWPVVSTSNLIFRLSNIDFQKTLSYEDSLPYALSLSISAAIANQIEASSMSVMELPPLMEADRYALEALRIRDVYAHSMIPCTETILTSYYLYVYFTTVRGGTQASLQYLQEAVSTTQQLGLHNPMTYLTKSPHETHLLSKVYHLLLVTERVISIQHGFQLVLTTGIPLPTIEDDEYPFALVEFVDLLKLFVNSEATINPKIEVLANNINDSSSSGNIPNLNTNYNDSYR